MIVGYRPPTVRHDHANILKHQICLRSPLCVFTVLADRGRGRALYRDPGRIHRVSI